MPYSTADEVIASLPSDFLDQLSDDAGGVLLDSDVITNAVSFADGMIDLYLSKAYTVPLTVVPGSINRLSVRLARYFLYLRRGLEEYFRADYDSCLKMLEALLAGDAELPTDEQGGGTEAIVGVDIGYQTMIMDRSSLARF